jgi:hypothetical protein
VNYLSFDAAKDYVLSVLKYETSLVESGSDPKGKLSKRIINLMQLLSSEHNINSLDTIFGKIRSYINIIFSEYML